MGNGMAYRITRAEGSYYWDSEGRKHLDFIGDVGPMLLGHNNPFVINNLLKYLDSKPDSMDVMSLRHITAAFAHNLNLVVPELPRTVVCGGGGAEAVETIIKMCQVAAGRTKQGKKRILSTSNSFHGKTAGAVFTGGKDIWQRWQVPVPGHVYVPYGDAAAAEEELKKGDIILFIAEPIQGEGGIIVPPDDYFYKIRELCDKYDTYFILDEIQAGSCRTGSIFAHKFYKDLVPDGFTFAKAMSAGVLPVAGVQAKEDLYMAAYGDPDSCMMHTATYQDNLISAAVGLSALQFMLENDVPGQIRRDSVYYWDGLRKIQQKYPEFLVDARGRGYMSGLQFSGKADEVGKYLAEDHMIQTMTTINNDTTLRIYPNICTTVEDFDWFFDALEKTIKKVFNA
jgi:putrescine aminotransferase